MKWEYFRATGYKNFYQGMGLNVLEIDFRKAISNKIFIKGANGTGKSSLLRILTPLVDNNSLFLEHIYAEKYGILVHNDVRYEIKCIHDIDDKGKRKTTKAYIYKIIGDEKVCLNPNGNVSSYNDAIYDELQLDSNFLALLRLSSAKRGLADMSSAERKKFVNDIISDLDVYNGIYKNLNKKSIIYKSMINNINGKINNIGNIEDIETTLVSVENRLNKLLETKDNYMELLSTAKSKIRLLDPDGNIQSTYDKIYNSLVEINNTRTELIEQIKTNVVNNLGLDEKITMNELISKHNEIKDKYDTLQVDVKIKESSICNILTEKENQSKKIQEKVAKLESLSCGYNDQLIKNQISAVQKNIDECVLLISKMGLDGIDITTDEYLACANLLSTIKEVILTFKTDLDQNCLEKAAYYIQTNSQPSIIEIDKEIEILMNELSNLNAKYNTKLLLEQSSQILSQRPSSCKNDSCPFIKKAVESINELSKMDNLDIQIKEVEQQLEMKKQEKSNIQIELQYIGMMNNIIRDIISHAYVLKKLPFDTSVFGDPIRLMNIICNGYNWKEIDMLANYIDRANILDSYKNSISILEKLENEKKLYDSKASIIDEITTEISVLNEDLNKIVANLEKTRKEIDDDKNTLSILNTLIMVFNNIFSLQAKLKECDSKKSELIASFEAIKQDMVNIQNAINDITFNENQIKTIESQINPIMQDRDKLKFGLEQLRGYYEELEVFKADYEFIEVIKKYSSPSKDGIQNLFVEAYMNTTTRLSNELLSLLFDGQYYLEKFIINENEFRIPVLNERIPNDDISSMSTSQVCMIGMILSCVMIYQSSTKYNIISLDEIDSGLDSYNRTQFSIVFDKVIELLGIEQIFVVSHNQELVMDNCDIIQFTHIKGEPTYDNCNIIFDIDNIKSNELILK